MTLQEALKVNELPLKIVHRTHGNITVIGKSTLVRHGMPDDSVYVAEPDDNVSRGPLRVYGSDKVKIWKEPCAHEPIEYDLNLIAEAGHYDPKLGAYDLKRTTQSKSFVFGSECKHCGVKLKAEKWIEA